MKIPQIGEVSSEFLGTCDNAIQIFDLFLTVFKKSEKKLKYFHEKLSCLS